MCSRVLLLALSVGVCKNVCSNLYLHAASTASSFFVVRALISGDTGGGGCELYWIVLYYDVVLLLYCAASVNYVPVEPSICYVHVFHCHANQTTCRQATKRLLRTTLGAHSYLVFRATLTLGIIVTWLVLQLSWSNQAIKGDHYKQLKLPRINIHSMRNARGVRAHLYLVVNLWCEIVNLLLSSANRDKSTQQPAGCIWLFFVDPKV